MAKDSVEQIKRYCTLATRRMASIFHQGSPAYQRCIIVCRPGKVGARDTALNAGDCLVLQVGKRKFARVTIL
jgi:hypothetical protein